ncbi:hypothetical protein [Paraburkholderia sp. BL10I2N1]|uniref:hypothetical protein n=1 Tax=Paraburkholderia sp. BL10I2N1 TaxID=1938796 RepID=UPI001060CC00|nr:hypothetical protein [Paraburkholderia sp. BL10I2N1]TDN68869.1 hypothetical protein B0G77_2224 [Paraburkholderia sp. BL10I2N1]
MPRTMRATKNETSLKDEWVQHIIRRTVIAAVLFDPKVAETLLKIPDAALGRIFKNHLCEVVGVATVYGIDLPALREEEENLRKRVKRASQRTPEHEPLPGANKANAERYPLVLQGKVLRTSDFCAAAGITEKKLDKYVASSRMFRVYFGPEPYYPAFFLSHMIFRDDFAKVIRRLGEIDSWTMFDFFTTPVDSLGGSTPLQRLSAEDVEPVVEEAVRFAEQYARLFP